MDLTWIGPDLDTGVEGYEVYRGDVLLARVNMTMARETGLAPAREYCYTVRAFDAAGNRSAWSGRACAQTPDVTSPSVPERLAATLSAPTEVALEWLASTDDVGVAGYELLRADDVVARVSGTRAGSAGLGPARRYCFTVRALDAAGNRSAPSQPACVVTPDVTPPTPPTALASEARPAQVQLRWSPSTDDVRVAGYELLRGGAVIATVAECTAIESGLHAAVEHCYTVRAFDAAGNRSAPSAPACATPPDVTPPSVPASLAGASPSETEVQLRWNPSTDDVGVVGYEVLRGEAIVTSVKEHHASEAKLRAGTRYCYTVRAYDAAGNRSAPGAPVCVTTLDLTPPSAPVQVVASADSDRQVRVRWGPSTDNVGVVGYAIRRAGAEALHADGKATSMAEAGLSPAKQYCYTVVALDAAGNKSAPSNVACATTPDLTPPSAPGSVAAAPSSSTQIVFAWSPSTDDVGVAGYEVLRKGALVAKASRTAAAEAKLEPSTEYCYSVRAYDAAGNRSKPSSAVCAKTADPSLPAGPTDLQARAGTVDEVILDWEPSPDKGVIYVVYWEKNKSVATTPLTTLKIFGQHARERHCYTVAARNDEGRESPRTFSVCASASQALSSR